MHSLICVVVSTLFATVSCYEEFQCNFESEYLDVGKADRKENQHIWGDEVQPLEFKTEEEFKSFEDKIVQRKELFYGQNLVNTIDTYYPMYAEAKHFPFPNPLKACFADKIKEFSIHYHPKDFGSDNLGLLVKFLRDISENVPEVKDHCFVGLYIYQVSNSEMVKYAGNDPPAQSEMEYPVGLIKVSVNGKLGYIVLNMEYAITDLVMEDHHFPEASEIESNKSDIKYQMGESKTYLEVHENVYDEQSGSYVPPIKSDVIYVGRPLCSFVETHIRKTLLHTHSLSLLKYGADFQLDAGLVALLYNDSSTERFLISYIRPVLGEKTPEGEQKWDYDTLSFNEIEDLKADDIKKFTIAADMIFGKAFSAINMELLQEKVGKVTAKGFLLEKHD